MIARSGKVVTRIISTSNFPSVLVPCLAQAHSRRSTAHWRLKRRDSLRSQMPMSIPKTEGIYNGGII